MATEVIVKKKAYRILTDVKNRVWNKIAFWTTADSVDANDGKNLQTKVGAIDGITSDINGESERIAASIKCVNRLKKSVSDGKSTIASAITAKGVSTAADATFATMATNIRNIQTSKTYPVSVQFDGANINNLIVKIGDTEVINVASVGTYGEWNQKKVEGTFTG